VSARYIRLLGVTPDPRYGYSIFAFEVRAAAGGPDLAAHRPTTASSFDAGKEPQLATDGSMSTRWAVSRGDRSRADSWLSVDLGSTSSVGQVTVYWESAAGREFRIQTSENGTDWTDRADYPTVHRTRGWLGIEDRVGLVVRGSGNPIQVGGDTVVLSAGPAAGSAGMIVEGHPSVRSSELPALAAAAAPSADHAAVLASLLEGHLSLFNLSAEPVSATVFLPGDGDSVPLFAGSQTVAAVGSSLQVQLPAASSAVLPPRATITDIHGRRPPTGLRVTVLDAATIRLQGVPAVLRVTGATGGTETVAVPPGRSAEARLDVPGYPLSDLAAGCTTFPTSPLPPGMSSPTAAVDGRPETAWNFGDSGRMVVDLGAEQAIGRVEVQWTTGSAPAAVVQTSADGLSYTTVGPLRTRADRGEVEVAGTARYVAVSIENRGDAEADVRRVSVLPAS
jgi:hypothetical protein